MMLVDCQTCPVRDVQCADCMVTALSIPFGVAPTAGLALAAPLADDALPLDRDERRAVSAFLAAGLVTADTANGLRAVRDVPVGPRAAGRGGPSGTRHAV